VIAEKQNIFEIDEFVVSASEPGPITVGADGRQLPRHSIGKHALCGSRLKAGTTKEGAHLPQAKALASNYPTG
jgi:hypothetical protein